MARKSAKKYNNNARDDRNGGRHDNGRGNGKIRGRSGAINAISGKISVNLKGFGFFTPENGGNDIFIAPENLRGALNGDKVKIRVIGQFRGKKEGIIVEIVERVNKIVVGTLNKVGNRIFVTPDDKRIDKIILPKFKQKFAANTKVVVKITAWEPLRGQIIEVLGKENAPGVEIRGILRSHGVSEDFPPEVQAEASKIELEPDKNEISRRIDRRNLKIVTIDGEDAKDLDDGVYAEKLFDGGFFLGVYIADVSFYVKPRSFLDKEAFNRGTSIYPVDRVVPMLPKELSNGICSLNAGVDRLAMACEMKLDNSGKVIDYSIFPTVIHVFKRLTYTQVDKFLDGDKILLDCAENLNVLKKIRDLRKKIRFERGAIDFDLPEMKILLNSAGKPLEITKRVQTVAESIIEECMLLANETVAEHTLKNKIPSLYRVHELPNPEKVLILNNLLAHFSLHIAKSSEPRNFQKILSKIKGLASEKVITSYALRTMQQARYSPQNLGHFGLAARFYTHFTSPIRRYPDLIVHRALKGVKMTNLEEISRQSSEMERRAVEIEREALNLKAVEYMQRFVGQNFDGVIESVTNFGFFVELDNGVDGLVRAADLKNDYYEFVEREFALIGHATGKSYRIGDNVRVKLTSANVKLRQLSFELVSDVANRDLIAKM